MGSHCVVEAGLDSYFPALVIQVPGFQVCATILGQIILLLFFGPKDHTQGPEISRQIFLSLKFIPQSLERCVFNERSVVTPGVTRQLSKQNYCIFIFLLSH